MSIDLTRFCACALDERTRLQAPWRVREFVYATNGHIAVRVSAEGYPDAVDAIAGKHPDVERLIRAALDGDSEFLVMPKIPAAPRCVTCAGRGSFHGAVCAECGGEGDFVHGTHTYDCAECDASGQIASDNPSDPLLPCRECNGRGFDRSDPFKLGDAAFDIGHLNWLQDLPQLRVKTNGPTNPAAFVFDGGHAILMPMKV